VSNDIQSHYDAINAWCVETAKALSAECGQDIDSVQVTINPRHMVWVTVFPQWPSKDCISRNGKTVDEALRLCRKELKAEVARRPDLAAILGVDQ